VPSPTEVVDDLLASLEGPTPRSPASWRVYRAALLFHLAENRSRSLQHEAAYQRLAKVAQRQDRSSTAGQEALTSAGSTSTRPSRARKGIPLEDLVRLLNCLNELNSNRTTVGSDLQLWLQAAIGCGARVSEWPDVVWADRGKCLLSVPNSKLKAAAPASLALARSRAAGGTPLSARDLEPDDEDYSSRRARRRLVRVSAEDAVWIDLHLSSMWQYMGQQMSQGASRERAYELYYNRCRNALLTACRLAFAGKRSYSLRMARSQFAANAKNEFRLEEVAEMMGHALDRTTRGNYAPRRDGYGFRGTGAPADGLRQQQRRGAAAWHSTLIQPGGKRD
jgi:integrase